MRFDIVTLFPELFEPFLRVGITRRAFEANAQGVKAVDVRLVQLRDYAPGNYRRVDDRPYGGGPGMLMMAQPLADCVDAIRADRASVGGSEVKHTPVILFSPIGQRFDHAQAARLADLSSPGAILICGRYEGIDQRFIDAYVTDQISMGDFVLSGGEIAAMAVLDAVARLQPGVLGDAQSHAQDSFNPTLDGLLDCPHYTAPQEWRGAAVPPVLLSGNHSHIERWRSEQRRAVTATHRPDLL